MVRITGGIVSIIIPVYNVAPYLAEAMDSVIRQSYGNLEIIIIDDGSTDGSAEMCDDYARRDRRIRLIHQENKGIGAARNLGLDIMNGEAVAFLDSDDAYDPDFIEDLVSAMVREEADIVLCKWSVFRITGIMAGTEPEAVCPAIGPGMYGRVRALRALLDGGINYGIWNKLYSRELWKDLRFPVGVAHEDVSTTCGIIDICRTLCVIDKKLYLYRKRPGSITETFSKKNCFDWLLSRSRLEAFVEANIPGVFDPDYLKRCRQLRIRKIIRFYLRGLREGIGSDREFLESLRTQIAGIGGIDNCNFAMKASYWMIRYCPWFLNTFYPAYRFARYRCGIWAR